VLVVVHANAVAEKVVAIAVVRPVLLVAMQKPVIVAGLPVRFAEIKLVANL